MENKKSQKIGLYFGSFNPIHIGHMVIANYMLEFTDLDKIWFVVSPHNPLKDKKSLLADYHRLEMVYLAINDDYDMHASNIEFNMPQPSYTIDTLTYLQEKYPKNPGINCAARKNPPSKMRINPPTIPRLFSMINKPPI